MQQFFDVVQNRAGQALPGITVQVLTSTGAVASLYSDNGFTPKTNPLTTNSDGEYSFYAANGTYTLNLSGPGYVSETREGVVVFDPADANIVSVQSFGARGDGSNETVKLQAALDAAEGSVLLLEGGKTYGYTALTIKPNTTIVSNGATFNRLAASTTPGFTIGSGVSIDALIITTPGGTSGDRAIRITGSNVEFGNLSITAAAQGNSISTNYAVEIESSPSGTQLSDITIRNFYCKYFSTAIFAKNVTRMIVENVIAEYYSLAVYLRDVTYSDFSSVTCQYLGAAVDGTPGENGLLIEASLTSYSSRFLRFSGWQVSDAGEHAYRLGGQLAISDVWFDDCTATRPGSAILGGNTSGGEWHGGCGFKVLGGNTTTTEFHQNIHFTNCGVIDCNTTYGTYPTGHGVNNFTPWLIVMAKNVHLSSCWTKAVGQPIVARNGVLFTAVDGLFLDNLSVRDASLTALKPYQEASNPSYPGSDLPIKNLVVTGGLYEVTTATGGIPFYFEEAADQAHENWMVNSATFKGGASAIRINTVGTGSFTDLFFDFTYVDTNVTDSTTTTATIAGGGAVGAVATVVAPWRPLATSTVANGSTWLSANDGEFRVRSLNVWRAQGQAYGSGWQPTATNVTNLDASSASFANYAVVGTTVMISGQMTLDPTATGSIVVRFTLPVASDFTAARQAAGVVSSSNRTIVGTFNADTTNDQILITADATTTASTTVQFSGTYALI
jgi:hypothetical protein